VCSTDMGHFKNDVFEGTNATGSYNSNIYAFYILLKKLTDSSCRVIPARRRYTIGPMDRSLRVDKRNQRDVADLCGGNNRCRMRLYLRGFRSFQGRHTGGKVFEDALQISKGMYCVPHLDRNIRQHKGMQSINSWRKIFPPTPYFIFRQRIRPRNSKYDCTRLGKGTRTLRSTFKL
jgi:hypothetical protein